MVNLVRGKRSFCGRLDKEASLVKFDASGDKFFMVVEDKVGVHEAEDARLVFELENPKQKRVLCASPGEVSLFSELVLLLLMLYFVVTFTCVLLFYMNYKDEILSIIWD